MPVLTRALLLGMAAAWSVSALCTPSMAAAVVIDRHYDQDSTLTGSCTVTGIDSSSCVFKFRPIGPKRKFEVQYISCKVDMKNGAVVQSITLGEFRNNTYFPLVYSKSEPGGVGPDFTSYVTSDNILVKLTGVPFVTIGVATNGNDIGGNGVSCLISGYVEVYQ